VVSSRPSRPSGSTAGVGRKELFDISSNLLHMKIPYQRYVLPIIFKACLLTSLVACGIRVDANHYKIVFSIQDHRDAGDIYLANADGTDVRKLTHGKANDIQPVWSQDKTRIAFLSDRESINYDVFIINVDGTNLTNITNNEDGESWPDWSPDGSRIAFNSFHNGDREIFVVNPDGTGLINVSNLPGLDILGSWSPESERIVFVHYYEDSSTSDIFVVDADGSNLTNITNERYFYDNPQWSPDGSRIAFGSDRNASDHDVWCNSKPQCKSEIYTINTDGTELKRLTFDRAGDYSPRWSPDGKKIAFMSYRLDPNFENCEYSPSEIPTNFCMSGIYIIRANGSELTKLTSNSTAEIFLSWLPNSAEIAFRYSNNYEVGIYVINLDSSEVFRYPDPFAEAAHLDW
jgi:Tol biopolymer transport system component